MNEEMKMHIFEYLKDNLTIRCEKSGGDFYSRDSLEVSIQLRNPETDVLETIATDSCSIE